MTKGKRNMSEYPVLVTRREFDGENLFVAEIPDLKGCSASADTESKAIRKVRRLAETWVGVAEKIGQAVPPPEKEDQFSGRFVVRITHNMHKSLHEKAKQEGISLNSLIRRIFADAADRTVSGNEVLSKLDDLAGMVADMRARLRMHNCPFLSFNISYTLGRELFSRRVKADVTFTPPTPKEMFS